MTSICFSQNLEISDEFELIKSNKSFSVQLHKQFTIPVVTFKAKNIYKPFKSTIIKSNNVKSKQVYETIKLDDFKQNIVNQLSISRDLIGKIKWIERQINVIDDMILNLIIRIDNTRVKTLAKHRQQVG